MIDYFQAETRPPPGTDIIDDIRKAKDVFSMYCHDTGKEVLSVASLQSIVKIRQSAGKVIIGCSLHQYYNLITNDIRDNSNLFTYEQCLIALKTISKDMGVPLHLWKIRVLEYGINIPFPYDINDLLKVEIVYRKGIGHLNFKSVKDASFEQSKKKLKIYHKPFDGIEQVRFEKRLKEHSQVFLDLKIRSLHDITDHRTWEFMKNDLIGELNKILIIDLASRRGNSEMRKFRNKSYWDDLESDVRNGNLSRPTFSKRWKKAHEKTSKYGYNSKKKALKINLLKEYHKMIAPTIPGKKEFTNCALSISEKCKPEHRVCIVTTLDISSQRIGSKYLSQKSILKLSMNDPNMYNILELKYLTHRWKSSPLEKRAYYIAHNIRNEDLRRIKQMRQQQSHFDTLKAKTSNQDKRYAIPAIITLPEVIRPTVPRH